MYESGVIDEGTLRQFVQDEIQAGRILTPCWESVEVELTGRRYGGLVEYTIAGIAGNWF